MNRMQWSRFAISVLSFSVAGALVAAEITVTNTGELVRAFKRLEPGTTVLIAPGEYAGNHWLENKSGTAKARITIRGADPDRPPIIKGGMNGIALSDCNHVTLAHLKIRGCTANGLNIHDGGSLDTPLHHLIVEHVTIEDIGPKGNRDGIKMSGVDDFVVRHCTIRGWGGSAIDMVGCHRGVIENCHFEGKKGFSQSNGVQHKGGSSDVLLHSSFFKNCGFRCVNLGGGTNLKYVRPQNADYEARRITVAGNLFVGTPTVVAFATSLNGHVHHNTIYLPTRRPIMIVQEQQHERFKPCAHGVFEHNLVVYDRRANQMVTVGEKTAPRTFVFRRNAWFCTDGGGKPRLPVPEAGGVYQLDPRLEKPGTPEMKITSKDPRLRAIGAHAYEPPRIGKSGK